MESADQDKHFFHKMIESPDQKISTNSAGIEMSETLPSQETEHAPVNWSVTAVLGLTFLAAVTVVPWYGITYGFSGWAWLFFAFFLVFNGIGIGSG